MRAVRAVLAVAVLVAALTGCGAADDGDAGGGDGGGDSGGEGAAVTGPLPAGLTAYVDQGREQRASRTFRIRLVNEADRVLTISRAELASTRLDAITWTGDEQLDNEVDLELELPPGRCGTGSDMTVDLTWQAGDGPATTSTTTATDRYGQVGLQLDRDCAQRVLEEAATVEVGTPPTSGTGLESVLTVPVTLTPTGDGSPGVTFSGFEDTVLFSQVAGSASAASGTRVPLTGAAQEVELRVRPSRCDPHALAEDKVGTLVETRVEAAGLPDGAAFYLPMPDETRAALRGFFAEHCGF